MQVQAPATQTWPSPHAVKFVAAAPVSTQLDVPEAQVVAPTWHGSAGVHASPERHTAHWPLRHTWLVPHETPSARDDPASLQTGVPVEQEVVPAWQGFAGVQTAPAVQATQVPALHTWFGPQAVPLATGAPVSVQLVMPPAHDTVPAWHALVGVHTAPLLQTQLPAAHVWLVPQVVPSAALPDSAHWGEPVAQLMAPVRHGVAGLHAPPGTHWQTPPAQAWLLPQAVPSGRFPLGVHTGAPVPQPIEPVRQASLTLQAAPAAHTVHAPALQTRSVPHAAPFGRLLPESTHTESPLAHDVVPEWQALSGGHTADAMQSPHCPSRQTRLVPHEEPFGALAMVAAHVETPPAHEVAPTRHGLAGVQATPAVQSMQPPLWHTRAAPHVVPSATDTPVSVQTDVPLAQEVIPVWQASAGVHDAAAVHARQAPWRHTWLVPQTVPSAIARPVSVQIGLPLSQVRAPSWQRVGGVQDIPVWQATQLPALQTFPLPQAVPLGTAFLVSRQTGWPVLQSTTPA